MILSLKRLAPAIAGFSLLSACAAPIVATTVETTGMPSAELALQRAIARVNTDMTRIGEAYPATYAPAPDAGSVVPAELQKPVQFVWTGPLDAGVKKLADSIGYVVTIYKPDNARPLPVAVNVSGQVLGAFEALGNQAGTTATVAVDPLHHQVQVTHHV